MFAVNAALDLHPPIATAGRRSEGCDPFAHVTANSFSPEVVMRRSKQIRFALGRGVVIAGGGVGLAAGGTSSSAVSSTASKTGAAPTRTATINVSTATVAGKSEQVLVDARGLPLYTFIDDTPGQVTGQDVQGFFVATPGLRPR
jgi:hypothetical protein